MICCCGRKYKRTGRWEAHIWQSRGSAPGSLKKGRQVHLGSFNDGDRAAQCARVPALLSQPSCSHACMAARMPATGSCAGFMKSAVLIKISGLVKFAKCAGH